MTDVYDRIKELKIYTKIVDKTNQLDKLFTALAKAQGEFVGMELNAKGWHGDYADLNKCGQVYLSADTERCLLLMFYSPT